MGIFNRTLVKENIENYYYFLIKYFIQIACKERLYSKAYETLRRSLMGPVPDPDFPPYKFSDIRRAFPREKYPEVKVKA